MYKGDNRHFFGPENIFSLNNVVTQKDSLSILVIFVAYARFDATHS